MDIKIDTGAYTSAIHCQEIEVKQLEGKEFLVFTVLDPTHSQYGKGEFSTDEFSEKRIKNSFGGSEKRFVIESDIRLFGKIYGIELSLSKRGEMRFPILIGRRFLMGKFIVDPSKYDLSYKRRKTKQNENSNPITPTPAVLNKKTGRSRKKIRSRDADRRSPEM